MEPVEEIPITISQTPVAPAFESDVISKSELMTAAELPTEETFEEQFEAPPIQQ